MPSPCNGWRGKITFSSIAHFQTVRTILALTIELQWPVYQPDFKLEFFNGDLPEEVYVAQPENFVRKSKETKIYKLRKPWYRIKQVP